MGLPFPFVSAYERMVRDAARHELPAGACWDLLDVFPDMDAPARARGAWGEYANAGIKHIPIALGWCDFSGNPQHLVIASDGSAISISAAGAVIGVGQVDGASIPEPPPRMVSLNDKLIFPLTQDGGGVLNIYDGTNPVTQATGSPSAPKDVAVYGDFVVACSGDKVYFSNPGDPTTWDTSTSFIQIQDEIIGLGSLRGVLIVFCEGSIWRIRGTVPPGNGPSNMVVDLLSSGMQGVIDPRSINYYASTCLFANDQGIWQTDGTTLRSLTEKFGMQHYWRDLIEKDGSVAAQAWVHRGYYFVTLWKNLDTNPVVIDTLACDLDRGSFFRMSNMPFFAACDSIVNGLDDASFAYRHSDGSARVGTISQVFEFDTSGVDPNGASIMPTIETPSLRGFLRLHRKWIMSPGQQTWRNAYLNYDLTGGGKLDVSYTANPEVDGVYNSLPNWGQGSLPATNGKKRFRLPLQFTVSDLAFKFAVMNSGPQWTSFRMWETEVEFYPRETSRV